jgi:hypothetical protein
LTLPDELVRLKDEQPKDSAFKCHDTVNSTTVLPVKLIALGVCRKCFDAKQKYLTLLVYLRYILRHDLFCPGHNPLLGRGIFLSALPLQSTPSRRLPSLG